MNGAKLTRKPDGNSFNVTAIASEVEDQIGSRGKACIVCSVAEVNTVAGKFKQDTVPESFSNRALASKSLTRIPASSGKVALNSL